VVREFPVYIGLIVVMGLISAGLSTLESLIQSLSTTVTKDILDPLFGEALGLRNKGKNGIFINKMVIVAIAVLSVVLSWDQIVNPKLSVGIFAQNGVYAYFSAAFVPILFGMFFKGVSLQAVFSASVVAVLTHFTMYYAMLPVPFTQATGENPGVAAAVAITFSVITVLAVNKAQGRSLKTVEQVPTPKEEMS
jgi:sodium/pantothenate symporter